MKRETTFILRNEAIRQNAIALIGKLPVQDKALWVVKVAPYVERRSLLQNSLAHLWLQTIANETGNTMADVKEYTKKLFLKPVAREFKDPLTGEVLITEITPSTADLNVSEMTEYLNHLEQFAIDFGVSLPYPADLIAAR